MKLLLLLLLSFTLITCSGLDRSEKNNLKRDLDDSAVFLRLKIYMDLTNYYQTFPTTILGEEGKTILLKAINNSKSIVENMVKIETDINSNEYLDIDDESRDDWGIDYWDSDVMEYISFGRDKNNYFVLFKFSSTINNMASPKILFQYANRIATIGLITINPEKIKDKLNDDEFLNTLMLHQFIHLLGFQKKTREEGGDDTMLLFGGIINERIVEGVTHYYLSKDLGNNNVIDYAQKYFHCDTLTEIELEVDDDGNVHWPSRYFLGELMTSFNYPEEQVLSGFTLAFLKDLGYLEINEFYTGGLMKFGKNKGCDFLNKKCGEDLGENIITFANEFYVPVNIFSLPSEFEPSCSSGRLSKTVHKLYFENEEPQGAEYYINELTGKNSINYCPISEYDTQSSTNNIGHCFQANAYINEDLQQKLGETFSSSSFCVLSSLISKAIDNYESYKKLRAVCYQMICGTRSLSIKIGDNYIVCPRTGGKITAKNFDGYILCPDYYLICSGDKLCNNLFDCISKGSNEKEYEYDYDIKTTQNSSVYETEDPIMGYELTTEGICPQLCKQCDKNFKCIDCIPHYKVYNQEDNKCLEIVPNCAEYTDDDICTNCKEGYELVKEDNNTLICLDSESVINEHYFYKPTELGYYIRCKNGVQNCEKCESSTVCTNCLGGLSLIDNGEICGNINAKIYYKDERDNKYKSCSKYISFPFCKECEFNGIGNFICLNCIDNYVLVHDIDEKISCTDKSTLANKYYSNDNKNYYPCNINNMENCDTCNSADTCISCISGYNIVNGNTFCILQSDIIEKKYYIDTNNYYYLCSESLDNCLKCDDKEKCLECKSGYKLVNNNKKCILQTDIDNHMYYYNPNLGIYTSCSSLISLCKKCNDDSNCFECTEEGALEENNTCISQELVENHYYYLDSDSKKYISCSIIENCVTCSSKTVCTSCQSGFKVKNNKCEKDNDDDGLSTGAIIGIVFGCVGFLLIVALSVFLLIKYKFKNEDNNLDKEKQENYNINQEENNTPNTKRTIQNV